MADKVGLSWHIGDVLRKVREARGLTRKELADIVKIRQNTLGDLERGMSNFEQGTLQRVAIALNVTIEGLYAELATVKTPPETDPVDAETIARFLKLSQDQKKAVRIIVDQFGLYPDRQRPAPEDHDHAVTPPRPASRNGP